MSEDVIELSTKTVDRLKVIPSVCRGHMTQKHAASQLGLCTRQIKRLAKRYREQGVQGLVSLRKGRPANNAIAASIQAKALSLVKENYHDFSPTFTHEKLTEKHGFKFSVETLRQWMIAAQYWKSKTRSKARIHPSRARRSRVGELIQVDGSPHDWFEGRAPECSLIVFIDDASSRLMALNFSPTETTQSYMEPLNNYLQRFGRPASIYSDKHSIFRVNHPDSEGELTQFGRALKTFEIESIQANSPQAKGRVERANQTLQDRLVKEMRLQGINSIEQANAFVPRFIEDYNRRFSVTPSSSEDAHRPVLHHQAEIDLILSSHATRTLSKNISFQYQNQLYQIQGVGNGYRLRKTKVTICEPFNGDITVLHQGKVLDYYCLAKGEKPIPLADEKTINSQVSQALLKQAKSPQWKPAPDHPWKKAFKPESVTSP